MTQTGLKLDYIIRHPATKIVCLILFILIANYYARQLNDSLDIQIRPGNEDSVHRLIILSAITYTILLAVPFVPGVEIGLGLMAIFGPKIVFLVYICTVTGLLLSFFAGRLIPLSLLIELTNRIKLKKMNRFLKQNERASQQEILELILRSTKNQYLPYFIRFRYLALAIAINTPGNFLIGGGGGIALLAGISRLFSYSGFLITIAVAVTPVPIAVMLFGTDFFSN